MPELKTLSVATDAALDYLKTLDQQPIAPTASLVELRARLDKPLSLTGIDSEQVIRDLVADVAGGLMGSGNGRFFGWVIGGALPVAIAADWLTSAWDQNGASNLTAPAEAVVEEIAGAWARDLLGLPESTTFGITTGSQMAHATALAAARHRLLVQRNWDVETMGLTGAPPIRILTTENRHESILRALRLLGIGTNAVRYLPTDKDGRMRADAAADSLKAAPETATILCLQAGDINTGIFDPFAEICPLARAAGAWVHVDGAIGLWAAASPKYRHLLAGAEQANSWVTDGHKWLNLPFDNALAFVNDAVAHRNAFAQSTSYSIPVETLRNQKDWNPEWSRRGRGFVLYAALRALGRSGVTDLVERCCHHADQLVRGIGALPGVEIVSAPVINQGLVRFLDSNGDHDSRTDRVIARIQSQGVAFFGGATWNNKRVMRISVCNWQTTDADVAQTIATVRDALMEAK